MIFMNQNLSHGYEVDPGECEGVHLHIEGGDAIWSGDFPSIICQSLVTS